MKLGLLNTEPILTNVATTGEFRIRNSAKAFNILSSGLYANKIRAVIRELSCNAVDSHVAAKVDKPFEVHLPNALEPWFAVQDYGTGLSHEQVINIYTTYFESTKADSNDYIGALGLGSKSPFSYTDNFTVTAVRDGIKNIYSAFIADNGVPSVSLMSTEVGSFANGVEVKFPVVKESDYQNFANEAREVFTYFAVRPTITGGSNFKFADIKYLERDIAPGIHEYESSGYGHSRARAIMGNICYPINIPNAANTLGKELTELLNCSIEIHFKLGELDIQASREGLSYIPETIAAIKAKLQELVNAAESHLNKKVAEITNQWDLVKYLNSRVSNTLFRAAVIQWCKKNNPPLFNNQFGNNYGTNLFNPLCVLESELAEKYNVSVQRFYVNHGHRTNTLMVTPSTEFDKASNSYKTTIKVPLDYAHIFVKNDTKAGALNRSRKHFGKHYADHRGTLVVFVMSQANRNLPANYDAVLKLLYQPQTVLLASQLDRIERKKYSNTKVGLFEVVVESNMAKRMRGKRWAWKEVLDVSSIKETIYYVPLNNKTAETAKYHDNVFDLVYHMRSSGIDKLKKARVFGVRKHQLEQVKSQSNFCLLEDFVEQVFAETTDSDIEKLATSHFVNSINLTYHISVAKLLPSTSPFKNMVENLYNLRTARDTDFDAMNFIRLSSTYRKNTSYLDIKNKVEQEFNSMMDHYPLVKFVDTSSHSRVPTIDVAKYINVIDKHGDK